MPTKDKVKRAAKADGDLSEFLAVDEKGKVALTKPWDEIPREPEPRRSGRTLLALCLLSAIISGFALVQLWSLLALIWDFAFGK